MAKVKIGITMSLDGYINDRSGSVDQLYPDFDLMHDSEPMRDAILNTGAVVMGRNAFRMADNPDSYAGNYEFQVPIFVLTYSIPKKQPKETDQISFTFVSDGIESAIRQAKAAAGNKDVFMIGGASAIQQCLKARLADELYIDIIPVLLCVGLRLFEDLGIEAVHLERIQVMEQPAGRTILGFRILR